MPRPKRSKVAPSIPLTLAELRALQSGKDAPTTNIGTRKHSSASPAFQSNGSDDSDGLVVARRDAKGNRLPSAQGHVMSGALAGGDVGATRLKSTSKDDRMSLTATSRRTGKEQATKGKAGTQKRRGDEEPSIPSTIPTQPIARTTKSSDSERSSAQESSPRVSISKIRETPRARTSLLGLGQFKKRARQPSLLQMVHSQPQPQDDVDEDDLYNFLPDDESTPFSRKLSNNLFAPSSSSSRPTSGSRKRKQAQPEVQVFASQPETAHSLPSRSPDRLLSPDTEDLYGVSDRENEPQPTLPPPRSDVTPAPQVFSDTLAPPASSSPIQPKPRAKRSTAAKAVPKSKGRAKQAKPKPTSPAIPPPSSPSSTQTSRVRLPSVKPVKPLSTATLQNLLPRRRTRQKKKTEYDILSSSDVEMQHTVLDGDDDELSFHTGKIRRKKTGLKGSKAGARSKNDASKRMSKTYSRKPAADDSDDNEDDNAENQDPADGNGRDAGEALTAGKGQEAGLDEQAQHEMKRLADKFREVDEYDMEFEDMTGSSQMKDAR